MCQWKLSMPNAASEAGLWLPGFIVTGCRETPTFTRTVLAVICLVGAAEMKNRPERLELD